MLLRGPCFFAHKDNRLKHEGDLVRARKTFFRERPSNLAYLLEKRYRWMNTYIDSEDIVVEVGSGAGFATEFISSATPILTDVEHQPWIALQVNAMHLPFADESIDVVICSHALHHLARPAAFLGEARRALKSGGRLLVQEVHTSLLMRLILRLARHEGWSYDVDVFDPRMVANDPNDPWSGNNSVPEQLFGDTQTFERCVPGFRFLRNEMNECLIFAISGGVVAKMTTINFPRQILKIVDRLDQALISFLPDVFALGRSVALEKV